MPSPVHKFPDPAAAAKACAGHILELIEQTLAAGRDANIAVSGGSTPQLMFADMARRQLDWERVHLFWVDERCVPPTDGQSNYRMAEEAFIGPAGFPRRNVHRIAGELEPEAAADQYAAGIARHFGLSGSELPRFDIIHRGIGADCHTASLFPGEPLIGNRDGIAAAVYVEKLKSRRVTLLPGVLLNATQTVMLVCGADKAKALHQIFEAAYDVKSCPAQLAARDGRSISWFVDEPAAVLI